MKLSYLQLREILSLAVSNETIRMTLSDLLSGKAGAMQEIDVIDILQKSKVDVELIRILSGKDVETLDAIEGVEYIIDFFGYIRANKEKFNVWLGSIGLKAEKQTGTI